MRAFIERILVIQFLLYSCLSCKKAKVLLIFPHSPSLRFETAECARKPWKPIILKEPIALRGSGWYLQAGLAGF